MIDVAPPARWYKYYLVAVCSSLVFIQYLVLAAQPQLLQWASWLPSPVVAALLTAINLMVFLPFLIWVYERWLWHLLAFRRYDFGGIWSYTNTYYDGSPETTGFVVITQSAMGLSFQEGVSVKNNPWKTRWSSTSANLDPTGTQIVLSYISHRKVAGHARPAKKFSVEELHVRDYDIRRGLLGRLRGRRPIFMESEFWNCIPEALPALLEHADAEGVWRPTLGRAEYRRATRSELEAARAEYHSDGVAAIAADKARDDYGSSND